MSSTLSDSRNPFPARGYNRCSWNSYSESSSEISSYCLRVVDEDVASGAESSFCLFPSVDADAESLVSLLVETLPDTDVDGVGASEIGRRKANFED